VLVGQSFPKHASDQSGSTCHEHTHDEASLIARSPRVGQ
jgi:hypothetical protein